MHKIAIFVAASAFLLSASLADAQTQVQSAPANPVPGISTAAGASNPDTNGNTNAQDTAYENQNLSGVRPLTLAAENTRSYWQPRFDASGTADSNPQQIGEGQAWTTWVTATLGIDVHRVTGKSDLSVGYTAGGMYSNQGTVNSGLIQGLNLADALSFRRSKLSIFDQASYLPESAFGFGGSGVPGLATTTLSAPGLAFNPGQTVLTGRGKMLNNSSAIELNYLLSPRSSLDFAGGYSLLHYFGAENGLLNYGVVNARAGYNYALSQRNTLAVLYTFGNYRYAEPGQSMADHTLQLSYGRLVTGKLAFQMAGGPMAVLSTFSGGNGLNATGGATNTPISQSQILWSLDSSLQYQEKRYGLGVSYSHGVSGGSGVLLGSVMDTVTGTLTRQMSRTFSSGFSGGYSRNQGLPGSGAFASQSFNYWFGGVNITEPIGSSLGLTLSYQVQYQTSNSVACVGPTCGENILRHLISVGIGWHERPLLF